MLLGLSSTASLALAFAAQLGATQPTLLVSTVAYGSAQEQPPYVRANVLAACERREGVRLLSEAELTHLGGDELLRRLRDCGGDGSCIGLALTGLDIRYAVIVAANLTVAPPFLVVLLVDAQTQKVFTRANNVSAEEVNIEEAIGKRVDTLFDEARVPRSTRIHLRTKPSDAIVAIDGGPPALASLGPFVVAPGDHVLALSREGYESATLPIAIARGEQREVEIMLEHEEVSLFSRPWFWAITAGAVALIGAGVTIAVLSAEKDPICIGRPSEDCEP